MAQIGYRTQIRLGDWETGGRGDGMPDTIFMTKERSDSLTLAQNWVQIGFRII